MESLRHILKKLVPRKTYQALTTPYHYVISLLAALRYGFPSRHIFVIGVTGTKGKSSTIELINAIFEEAGYKTALTNTIRFKIADKSLPNRYKMSMPGRFFMQKFLAQARSAGCRYAIIEMTSEGVKQYRHKWVALDALVFTNITPEHIESHGSFEKYLQAKLKLRDLLVKSSKENKWMIVNNDDKHAKDFLNAKGVLKLPFSLKDAGPYATTKRGILITVKGMSMYSPLLGLFNIHNILAAIKAAETRGIPLETIKRALEKCTHIAGRAESIEVGQPFTVIVDYAHTPDSLLKLYASFKESYKKSKKICVLGNTGGGRDKWKRPEMGAIADTYCNVIILTNEDPYDENPRAIVEEMAAGMKKHKPDIIMDRRSAIREALHRARKNDVVLITGKGTDPYICGPRETMEPWSDKKVVHEELKILLQEKNNGK